MGEVISADNSGFTFSQAHPAYGSILKLHMVSIHS